jgi:prefoldin subunit 5
MDMTVKDELEEEILFLEKEIEAIESKIAELSESYEENKSLLASLDMAANKKTLVYLDHKIKLNKLLILMAGAGNK